MSNDRDREAAEECIPIIDKLFLELSQVTKARTGKEIELSNKHSLAIGILKDIRSELLTDEKYEDIVLVINLFLEQGGRE